jgi:hypothetical protein
MTKPACFVTDLLMVSMGVCREVKGSVPGSKELGFEDLASLSYRFFEKILVKKKKIFLCSGRHGFTCS